MTARADGLRAGPGIAIDEPPRGVLATAARGGELVVGAAIVLVHQALRARYDRTPPS
jgi:hypothetical protein